MTIQTDPRIDDRASRHCGDVRVVGVIGGGQMGAGIAEACARSGLTVVVNEINSSSAAAAEARVRDSLGRAVRHGKVAASEAESAHQRITVGTDLAALAESDLVVEAVAEDETVKLETFARLDAILDCPDVILASNTSSIPIMKLAMATGRPGQVVGIHFFNPVPVLDLVELVPSLLTDENTLQRSEAFATALGKRVIRCQDRAGFVVNALLVPYLLAAIRMLESGFATAVDIDLGMKTGCAHPLGPLSLADLIGLDTVKAIAESMYEEFKESLYSPPPLLSRMVEAGLLGRKSGRGFHEYE